MLFELDKQNHSVNKTTKVRLFDIGWKEEDLQTLLYDNLDKVFPDDDLLLIMQSRKWQEEPDLMAIDSEGNLNIFELKAWESLDFNLLQALRYGQIFGQYKYESLNELYKKFNPSASDLLDTVNQKFSVSLKAEQINLKQKFIIITNGTDHKTRQSINYWAAQGLSIQSWVYRLHKLNEHTLIEFDRFKILDNPFEDLQGGYYILNTNIQGGGDDDEEMLKEGKAAAYFEPWKYKIENLKKGDTVFLYRSGTGIVAMGIASGDLKTKSYQDDDEYEDEEYYQKLKDFKILEKPIPASEIKKIGEVNYVFMQTMFGIDQDTGKELWKQGHG
ncbi:MAG: hypothetical protein Q8N38_06100 [Bacteroidales bacterium]|nr:hypothetical protein [Bacteroidales bacterium]